MTQPTAHGNSDGTMAINWSDLLVQSRSYVPNGVAPPPGAPVEPIQMTPEETLDALSERRAFDALINIRAKRKADAVDRRLRSVTNPLPVPLQLSEIMKIEFDPVRYRIAHWMPENTNGLLVAPKKAGKTTLIGNCVRCLVDGENFLDVPGWTVQSLTGSVVILDFEMNPAQLQSWYSDIGIASTDKVYICSLRGQGAAFDITIPEVRAEWAARLRDLACEYLVLDCLAPALGGIGMTESNEDLGRFLPAWDALKFEAGIGGSLTAHHFGWTGERGRGGSRLAGWADFEWRYILGRTDDGTEDERAPRYLSAYGRDVDMSESELTYLPLSRRLQFKGGTRSQNRANQHVQVVAEILRDSHPDPVPATELRAEVSERTGIRNATQVQAIVRAAVAQNLVTSGKNGRKVLYALPVWSGA